MTARPSRPRGRPSRADPDPVPSAPLVPPAGRNGTAPTAVAILDSAERLFAAQGFAATTIKQIGDAARLNPALLYYYFRDKETLYRAVIRRLVGGLVVEGMEEVLAELPPDVAITRLVHFQTRYLAAHPNAPRLMAREFADHEGSRAEEAFARLAATLFARVCDVIRSGQRQGVFRADLDPHFGAISTIAQVVYLFIARPAVGILLGHADRAVSDAELDAFADHAARFAVAALAAAPSTPSSASGASRHATTSSSPRRPRRGTS